MNSQKEITSVRQGETRSAGVEDAGGGDLHAPRNLSLVENVILTAKVLTILGLIGATLWGLNVWTNLR